MSGSQLLAVLEHFSGKKRVDLALDLAKYLRPDLSSRQFFSIITPDMDMQEFGYVYPPFSVKLEGPLKFSDYMSHANKMPTGMNRAYQATTLARHLEKLSKSQKEELAPLLGVTVDVVDVYL